MRITKETDGRDRKEQCSDKKDEDRRLRGRVQVQGKQMEKEQQET